MVLICDIDEILRRAETRDEAPTTVGDELLSAFKVASFAAFEEERDTQSEQEQDEETRDWDEIIPEAFRQKVEEEEKAKEMEDLYLPPRSRKTLQQINQSESDGEGSGRGRKRRKRGEESESSEEGSDDERPRKRGRPPGAKKEVIKGFTDAEIRRFIRSYKKFPAPLTRLEAIAGDAELQEKPLAEMRKLGEMLHERCLASIGEQSAQKENETEDSQQGPAAKKRGRGPSLKLGGVSVNAKSLLACEKELEPLDIELPANPEERSKWILELRVKPANFDVDWDKAEDSAILRGIYQYGMGSWEAVKMDPSLGISDKILLNEDKKPQSKHLQSRAEYLLKVLKKHIDQKNNGGSFVAKPKRLRKKDPKVPKVSAKAISKEIIDHDDSSGNENENSNKSQNLSTGDTNHRSATPVKSRPTPPAGKEEDSVDKVKTEKKKKESIPKKKKKKETGPMHFTANSEPRALDVIGDLEPATFNECKEKMRPVKKALKALDNPDHTQSEQEQVNHTRQCLVQIGDQIDKCLKEYKDAETIKEWRTNLWYFVSKFTEYDAKKLYKLYKHAVKKAKPSKDDDKSPHKESKDGNEHRKRRPDDDKSGDTPSKKPFLGSQKSGDKDDKKDKDRIKDKDRNRMQHDRMRTDSGGSGGVSTGSNMQRSNTQGGVGPGYRGPGGDNTNRNNVSNPHNNIRPPTDAGGDRWSGGGGNNRFGGGSDHKRDRDRYEQYPNRMPQGQGGYRDRDRNHRGGGGGGGSNKRRFHPGGPNYGNHYGPPPGYVGGFEHGGVAGAGPMPMYPRDNRYQGPPSFGQDWNRGGRPDGKDYNRRDYDNRRPPNSNS